MPFPLSNTLGGAAASEQHTGKGRAAKGRASKDQENQERALEASGHGILAPFAVLLSSAHVPLVVPGSTPPGSAAPKASRAAQAQADPARLRGLMHGAPAEPSPQSPPLVAPAPPLSAGTRRASDAGDSAASAAGTQASTEMPRPSAATSLAARPPAAMPPAAMPPATLRSSVQAVRLLLPAPTSAHRGEQPPAALDLRVAEQLRATSTSAPTSEPSAPPTGAPKPLTRGLLKGSGAADAVRAASLLQEGRTSQAARPEDAPGTRAPSPGADAAPKLQIRAEARPPAPLRAPDAKPPAPIHAETATRPASSDGHAPVAARTDAHADGHAQQQQRHPQGEGDAHRRRPAAGPSPQGAGPAKPEKTTSSFSLHSSTSDTKPAPGGASQGASPPAAPVLDAATPETARRTEDKADGWIASLTEAAKSSGKPRAEAAAAAARRALPVAWLQNVAQGPLRSAALENGWKQLEMPLREGDGTVVIKARREQDGMAVSVGFSEPRLQALAATHARQLQDALQAQYDAAVDFSLMDGNAFAGGDAHADGQTDGQAAGSFSARSAPSRRGPSSTAAPEGAPPSPGRPPHSDARHEWIG